MSIALDARMYVRVVAIIDTGAFARRRANDLLESQSIELEGGSITTQFVIKQFPSTGKLTAEELMSIETSVPKSRKSKPYFRQGEKW